MFSIFSSYYWVLFLSKSSPVGKKFLISVLVSKAQIIIYHLLIGTRVPARLPCDLPGVCRALCLFEVCQDAMEGLSRYQLQDAFDAEDQGDLAGSQHRCSHQEAVPYHCSVQQAALVLILTIYERDGLL